jgi:hypothetical protein
MLSTLALIVAAAALVFVGPPVSPPKGGETQGPPKGGHYVQPPNVQAPNVQPPKGVMPDLGRPTQADDKIPLFNFDEYFTGKWTFEWIVPESPLGPAGEMSGTTTFKPIEGKYYQADTEAKGPAGAIRIRERIAYHPDNKAIVRHVTDSRGFSYLTLAPIGADLAGIYYIYFESEPFVFKGRTMRIKENWRLVSPINNKVTLTIATDGGRFTNYGSPWWQKQIPETKR